MDYLDIPKFCYFSTLIVAGCNSLKKFVINNRINELPSRKHSFSYNAFYDVLYGTLNYYTTDIEGVSIDSLIIEDCSNPLYAPSYWLNITYDGKGCGYFRYLQTKYVYIGRDMTFENTNYGSHDYAPFNGNPYVEEIVFGDLCSYTTDIHAKSLTKVTFGKGMSIVSGNHFQNNVKELYLTSVVPPTVNIEFSNFLYVNAKIYVPKGTLEVYKSTDGWKNFWNIQEWDVTTGIESIDAEGDTDAVIEIARYNMNGQQIDAPQKGVNIIRYSDGHTKKVMVK